MMQTGGGEGKLYRTAGECVRHVLKEEGVRGFYRGLAPNIVRGFGSALLLVGYDEFKVLTNGSEERVG